MELCESDKISIPLNLMEQFPELLEKFIVHQFIILVSNYKDTNLKMTLMKLFIA